MTRKELEKLIGLPTRAYRKNGKVRVEVAYGETETEFKYAYAGQGKNVSDACQSFVLIHLDIIEAKQVGK